MYIYRERERERERDRERAREREREREAPPSGWRRPDARGVAGGPGQPGPEEGELLIGRAECNHHNCNHIFFSESARA